MSKIPNGSVFFCGVFLFYIHYFSYIVSTHYWPTCMAWDSVVMLTQPCNVSTIMWMCVLSECDEKKITAVLLLVFMRTCYTLTQFRLSCSTFVVCLHLSLRSIRCTYLSKHKHLRLVKTLYPHLQYFPPFSWRCQYNCTRWLWHCSINILHLKILASRNFGAFCW